MKCNIISSLFILNSFCPICANIIRGGISYVSNFIFGQGVFSRFDDVLLAKSRKEQFSILIFVHVFGFGEKNISLFYSPLSSKNFFKV